MRLLPAVCAATILVLSARFAHADGPAIHGEGQTSTEACGGAAASVAGSRNTITFTGECAGIEIRGESNTITLQLVPGSAIVIEGNRNRLRYTAPLGAHPTLSVAGNFNEVTPGPNTPAPAADTAKVAGDDETIELDCEGKSVTLQGVRSHYRLHGACAALTVRGEANTVQAGLAPNAQLLVEGNGIALTYTVRGGGGAPAGTVRGMGSSITRANAAVVLPAAPAAGGAVPVASVPLLMSQLDGIIVERGTLVKLPVAVFASEGLSPAGETQLARLAALIGQIHPKGLSLSGRDPAGAAAAQQRVALVHGWLDSHIGKRLPVTEQADSGDSGVDVLILR